MNNVTVSQTAYYPILSQRIYNQSNTHNILITIQVYNTGSSSGNGPWGIEIKGGIGTYDFYYTNLTFKILE